MPIIKKVKKVQKAKVKRPRYVTPWINLANQRVGKAVKAIALVENLARRKGEYSEDEGTAIQAAMRYACDRCIGAYEGKGDAPVFLLERKS